MIVRRELRFITTWRETEWNWVDGVWFGGSTLHHSCSGHKLEDFGEDRWS